MSAKEVYVGEQLVLQPAAGLVQFVRQGQVLLDRATAGVVYTGVRGEKRTLTLAGHDMSYGMARDSVSLSVADGQVELTWQVLLGEEMRLRLEVKNIGAHALRIEELHVLDVDRERGGVVGLRSPCRNWRFYQNGWQSWTPTFARHVADGIWVNPNTDDYRTKHEPHTFAETRRTFSSEWFTVIASDRPEPALLLGFTTAADQLAEIRLDLSPRLEFQALGAVSYVDGVPLAPGEKLSSETLLLTAGFGPLSLLDLYADRLGETMRARVPAYIPTGWCTWYYFYGEETAADVLTNIEWIRKKDLPLDLILIDDGYETNIGDWLDVSADKYPQGMEHVAEQIKVAGHRPGIWTAPFAVSFQSKLYAAHPDWVLRDQAGEPLVAWQHWGKDIYGLDLSRSAVQDWLRDLFQILSDDWGYEFFKIDFLYSAALPGVRQNSGMTRAQAVRRGLEIIRSAIGDKFLLGCGCPLGPAVGIVDAMRIGPDVHVDWRPFWQDMSAPSAANAMLNSIARGFMHGRLWANDADCLVLRPRGPDSNLVLNEMRTLTTVVGLSGGLVLDSDNLPTVCRGRLKYLRRVVPPYGRSATPLDLFEHEKPRWLALPISTSWGNWTILAALNWEDRSCTTTVDLAQLGLPSGAYHAYNYWRQRYLGVVHDQLVIEPHQPHEAVVLLLKRVSDQPQLLTSTFHILQGAVEIKEVVALPDRLMVEMEKPGKQYGRLVFAVPDGQAVSKVIVNGRSQRPQRIEDGIWQTGFVLSDRATVELVL